ncbi:hypothetical protein EDD21DRAFT_360604 [Dissophora ornata]|nr:hypothetical protein EDD21DRAFT_360604 [Dissophora ornata]
MVLFVLSALSLFAAVACAQPQTVAARATRAITVVGDNLYLYGGSGSGGNCYSDLYSLHLDPTNGWVAGSAPWNNIQPGNTPGPVLGTNSWAVGSTDGTSLLFYGQTLCPQQLATGQNSSHTYTSTSASVEFQLQSNSWTQTATAVDVLGPRLVKDDEPVPVQVVDTQDHTAYTFVYDAFNDQLGMQLWSFPTDHLPTNIAQTKNTTMVTTQPPTPSPPASVNGTNTTVSTPTVVTQVVLAPFVDAGAAVYISGTIVVLGGGKTTGSPLTGDDVDSASGWYMMDRCWVYTTTTNTWSVRNLTVSGGTFPLPRRLHALLAVGTNIYMHGGNTTQTVPTTTYASDMWILDTQTWHWTAGQSSLQGRASHTLINFQNTLMSISGFEFETSNTTAALNAFVMMYDTGASTWGSQFGTISQSFFQKYGAAIIGFSVAGFLIIVISASIAVRLWRRHNRGSVSARVAGGLSRKRTNKPFLPSATARNVVPMNTAASASHPSAAARLSGMTLGSHNQGPMESQIDLSALPHAGESTAYDGQNYQYPPQHQYNSYAPLDQQQQVPLMSANALDQQHDQLDPYVGDGPEERPQPHASHSSTEVPHAGSFTYPG